MDSSDRFLRRKQIRKDIESSNGLFMAPNSSLVQELLSSSTDVSAIQEFESEFNKEYDFEFDVDVSPQEVTLLLGTIQAEFDEQKFDALIAACRRDVLTAIVGPFGLGRLVAQGDKLGGNVTTIHNFKDGITATGEDAKRYKEYAKNNGSYNSGDSPPLKEARKPYDAELPGKRKEILKNKEPIISAYTGRELPRDGQMHLDHVIPVSQIERDSKAMLVVNKEQRIAITNAQENLVPCESSINQSMGDKDKSKWAEEERKGDQGKTNAEHFGVDNDRLEQTKKKAEQHVNKELSKEQIKKQGTEAVLTGAQEGLKMGAQQACGVLVGEFFSATFDELQDIYKNGFASGIEAKGFFTVLKERLLRIADKIAGRWNDVTEAFSRGFISGFLSNLVTVVINMFVRTEKRIVRIIREGFFSLLQAIKMVCSPPEGMTAAQAAHEASKLIAAGLTVAGGIAVEHHIDTLLKAVPQIEPFADVITAVLVGGLTGLATTFVIYAIDKADFFKVNNKEQHHFAMQKLEADLEGLFAEGNALIESMG